MKVIPTPLQGLLIFEPEVFHDSRGFFQESFNQQRFQAATGLHRDFVQDNHSRSTQGVLRGLHYQVGQPQGKLVRVARGRAFDVAVDMRQGSPTLGHWFGLELSEANALQMWVPEGFAHGFLALSPEVDLLYKPPLFMPPPQNAVFCGLIRTWRSHGRWRWPLYPIRTCRPRMRPRENLFTPRNAIG